MITRPPIILPGALAAWLLPWRGTPHRAGQKVPGPAGGVDCVRFPDEVLRQARRALGLPELDDLPRWAQDAAFHDPRVSARFEALMTARHGLRRVPLPEGPSGGSGPPLAVLAPLCPSGALLGVSMGENPFHVAIRGPGPAEVWHAGSTGVVKTSLQALTVGGMRVRRVYTSPYGLGGQL